MNMEAVTSVGPDGPYEAALAAENFVDFAHLVEEAKRVLDKTLLFPRIGEYTLPGDLRLVWVYTLERGLLYIKLLGKYLVYVQAKAENRPHAQAEETFLLTLHQYETELKSNSALAEIEPVLTLEKKARALLGLTKISLPHLQCQTENIWLARRRRDNLRNALSDKA